MGSASSPVAELERLLGTRWSNISRAREHTIAKKNELQSALAGVDSEDTSIVVFGSLARNEFTAGSDIDWTLLIDGSADPKHLDVARRIEEVVKHSGGKQPGREGSFGTMAFSHELIHQIGGEEDSNRNTTRRILLLLESSTLGRSEAYERVVTTVLLRYVQEDRGFVKSSGQFHVPRFLLNDFARYWWTVAVDFAYKQRTRFGEGAAMRNIKLRMSRKLIYVAGLLTCFSCHAPSGQLPAEQAPDWIDYLRNRLRQPPLEVLAESLLPLDHLRATAGKLFGAYDGFLEILSNTQYRKHLEKLELDECDTDQLFQTARQLSHDFREGLLELLFDSKSGFAELTKTYGVF